MVKTLSRRCLAQQQLKTHVKEEPQYVTQDADKLSLVQGTNM